jgi:hypothetical protein
MPSARARVGVVVVVIACPFGIAVAEQRLGNVNDVFKKVVVPGCKASV